MANKKYYGIYVYNNSISNENCTTTVNCELLIKSK